MTKTINWQQNSNSPENAANLAQIRDWWSNLNGQEVAFAQRLLPEAGNLEEIDWQPQRFDERFEMTKPELRGITLYWYKLDAEVERSFTPSKLELNLVRQQLYVYPQSQPRVVIRVGTPEIKYQTIELKDPQIASTAVGEGYLILIRDKQQQLEVRIRLSSQGISQLRHLVQ